AQDLKVKKEILEKIWHDYLYGKMYTEAPGIMYWSLFEHVCTSFFGETLVKKLKLDVEKVAGMATAKPCFVGENALVPATKGTPRVFSIFRADFEAARVEFAAAFGEGSDVVAEFQKWTAAADEKEEDLILFFY
ncbi:MAG: hypothetical protein AAF570_03395, partial [Bacteroidota bacterium]